MNKKNHEQGYSDLLVFIIPLIIGLFSAKIFHIESEKIEYVILTLLITILSMYLLGLSFFVYKIHPDSLTIWHPLKFKRRIIRFSSIVCVNFNMESDADDSGYSLNGVWVYYLDDQTSKKQILPIRRFKRGKILRILTLFKNHQIKLNINSKNAYLANKLID